MSSPRATSAPVVQACHRDSLNHQNHHLTTRHLAFTGRLPRLYRKIKPLKIYAAGQSRNLAPRLQTNNPARPTFVGSPHADHKSQKRQFLTTDITDEHGYKELRKGRSFTSGVRWVSG
jgi:hypothetical protein